MTEHIVPCPSCGSQVAAWESFCEGCGAQLTPTEDRPAALVAEDVPVTRAAAVPGSAPTAPATTRTCRECGGDVDIDGYCDQCGAKAPSERDHFVESPANWVGGVCDRGIRHHRNEDALALSADPAPGSAAVLVVCDGVSSSEDSHIASLAAARAARGVLVAHHPVGMAIEESQLKAMTATFADAFRAANDAVVATTAADSQNAASCTIAAAEIDDDLIVHANIGDSRVYWLADVGESRLLSVDDSVAQLQIAAGVDRARAESGPQAHAITRWLGRDAPDLNPATGHFRVPGNGWLLVCSDGLWNYASDPDDLEAVIARILLDDAEAGDPTVLADRLVRWANAQGGRDNITVALARFGSLDEFPGRMPMARETPFDDPGSAPTVHTVPVRPGTDSNPPADTFDTGPAGTGQSGPAIGGEQ